MTASVDRDRWIEAKKMKIPNTKLSCDQHAEHGWTAKLDEKDVHTGDDPGRDLTPKGGDPPPPSTDSKIVARHNVFCRRQTRRTFCFGHSQGDFFLFDPMRLNSKYLEFRGEFKNG